MFYPFIICHQFLLASTHNLVSGFGLLIYSEWNSCPVAKSCTTLTHWPPPLCWGGDFEWVLCTELAFTHSTELDHVLQGAEPVQVCTQPAMLTAAERACASWKISSVSVPPWCSIQRHLGNEGPSTVVLSITTPWCSARHSTKTLGVFHKVSFSGACLNSAYALCRVCHLLKRGGWTGSWGLKKSRKSGTWEMSKGVGSSREKSELVALTVCETDVEMHSWGRDLTYLSAL